MVTSVVLYVNGAASQRIPAHRVATSGGTTGDAGCDEHFKQLPRALVGDLIIKPAPALLDPATDGLKQDLTVAVTSATTPVRRTYSKGMLPGVFPVPLTLARDVEQAGRSIAYDTGPDVTVELFHGP